MGSKEDRERDKANMEKLRQQRAAETQARLDAEAAEEAAVQRMRDKTSDDDLMAGMSALFGGVDYSRFKDIDWLDDDSVKDRIKEIQRANAKGQSEKAAKIYKKNRKAIKKAVKKAGEKKKAANGCGVVALLLIGALVSALVSVAWFAHDVIGALTP